MKLKISVADKLNKSQGEDILIIRSAQHYVGSLDLKMIEKQSLTDERAFVTPLYQSEGYLCVSFCYKGRVLTQKAITLNEVIKGFKKCEEIAIFSFKGVNLALVVDVDLYRPEIARKLAIGGANLVLSQAHIFPKDYCFDFVTFGGFSMCQGNNLYGVFVNNLNCSVIAPCDATQDLTGFIEKEREGDFIFEVDLNRFYETQKSFPIFQSMNYELYKKELWEEEDA